MKGIIAVIMTAALLTAGCNLARDQSGETNATYEIGPEGLKKISFSSTKPYTGLKGRYELYPDGKVKAITVDVDQAGSEQAILQALLANSMTTNRLFELLLPAMQKAFAGAAAGAGVPLPLLEPRATVP